MILNLYEVSSVTKVAATYRGACVYVAGMDLAPGAAGYRVCNAPPMLCASLEASLKVRL